jgi:hypothetical protein
MIAYVAAGLVAWYLWPRIKKTITKEPEPQACQITRHDGRFVICLGRDSQGVWTWSAIGSATIELAESKHTSPGKTFASENDALADAWVSLLVFDAGKVVTNTREAWGLRLEPSGTVTVVNQAVYLNEAAKAITAASDAGDDAAGVVISLLTSAFGTNWNPLRAKIAGGTLQDAAQRYTAARGNPNPTPQSLAKAIMGLPA